MITLAIAGMAHPHADYIFDELAHRDDVQLVGLSDPDEANLAAGVAKLADLELAGADVAQLATYANHRELIDTQRPDVVAAFGVFGERADVVVAALAAGADVIADKPLCTTLADLDRIERAALATGGEVSVVFEKRWYPATLAVRRLVAEGVLGEIALVAATGPHKLRRDTRPDWFFTAEGYGDLLGDLPVHDVDLLLALTGARTGTVSGTSVRHPFAEHPDWSDAGALMLTSDDGVVATIEAHWLWPEGSDVHGEYAIRITGTGGVAEIDWAHSTLRLTTGDSPSTMIELGAGLRPAQDVLAACAEGRRPEVGTTESIAATRIALLAARSARDGGNPVTWSVSVDDASQPASD